MAIKITEVQSTDSVKKEMRCSIFADAKADVSGDLAAKLNLPDGFKLAYGSSVVTASLEVGMLKSNDSWQWN